MIFAQLGTPGVATRSWLLPAALCVSTAIASPQGDDPQLREEVVTVVGTHIPQVDAAGLSPVLVMDRQAIEASGSMYLADVLQQLPINNAGTFNDRDPLSSALGGSGISLRGLGADSVLLLVNGRRAASYGFSQQSSDGALVSFVDLNSIPVAAVERVEILKDGASAMYGSSAMAGVVNIVLRDHFVGTELQARVGQADRGGAEERSYSGIFGWQGERSNIELIASYSKRDGLAWVDRDVSDSANQEAEGGLDLRDIRGSNFSAEFGLGSFGADCEERNAGDESFELYDDWICLYNPNQAIVQPEAERTGLTLIGNYALSDELNLHFEGSYLGSEIESRLEPVELDGAIFPAQNPWNPFGVDVEAHYQLTETGPRINQVDADNYRAVLVLEGQRGDWSWEVGSLYHSAALHNRFDGQVGMSQLQSALNGLDLNDDGVLEDSEYLNLYSPSTNPDSRQLIDSLMISPNRQSKSALVSVLSKLVGPLMTLPAGKLVTAFGVEYMHETLKDRSSQLSAGLHLISQGYRDLWVALIDDERSRDTIDTFAEIDPWDLQGFQFVAPMGAPSASGSRNQNAVFAEVHVPVTERVKMQGALRYDAVDGIHSKVLPRIAVRYQPFDRYDHAVRASWGRGHRPPSLTELDLAASAKVQMSWDPERCPIDFGPIIDSRPYSGRTACIVKNFLTVLQGNADLDSESSESWSVGINSRYSDKVSSELDCWRVEIKNGITSLGTERILRYERNLGSDFVVRRPHDEDQFRGGNNLGFIDQINDRYINATDQKITGCDVEMDINVPTERHGVFGAQFAGSHMASNKFHILPGAPVEQLAGTSGHPKNRANLNLFWNTSKWRANLPC